MQPLHALLTSSTSKCQTLIWNDTALAVFNTAREALANASLLTYPAAEVPTCIMTDASDIAVGAVLQQYVGGAWCPISFFTKMTPAKTRYSAFDTVLLAVYLAIRHFCHLLEGCNFHVLTNHKPLPYTLNTQSDRQHSPLQAWQLDYISQFTSTTCHVQGSDNVVVDTLAYQD